MPIKSSVVAKPDSGILALQQVDIEQSFENESLAAIRIFLCSSDSTLDPVIASLVSLLKDHSRQKNIGIVSNSKWAPTILICHPGDIKLDPGFVEEISRLNPDLVVAVVETLPHDQFQCPADEEGRFLNDSRSILDILSSNLGKGLCLISSSTDESGLQDLIEPIISLAINKHDELEKKLASSILSKLLDSDRSGSLDPIDALFLAEIGHQIGLSLGLDADTGRDREETIREKLLASAERLTRQEISRFLDSPGVSEIPLQVEDLFGLYRFARARRAINETRSILKEYHAVDQDKLDDRVFPPILNDLPQRVILVDTDSMDPDPNNSSIQAAEQVGSYFTLVEIEEGYTLWVDDQKNRQIAVEFSDGDSLLPFIKKGTRLPYGDIITDQDEAIRLVSNSRRRIYIDDLPGDTVFDLLPAESAPGENLSEAAAKGVLVLIRLGRADRVECSLAQHSCPSVSFEPSFQQSEDSPGTQQCYQLAGAGKAWSDMGSFSGAMNLCLNRVQAHLAGILRDEASFREEFVPRKELNDLNEVKESLRELERNFKEQVEHGRGKLLETITDWERAKDEIKEINELIESALKDTASIDAQPEPSEKDLESMPIVREFWREFPFVKSLFIATKTLVEAFEAKTKTSRESLIEWLATSKTSREKITEYLSADLDCRSSHRISLGLVEKAIADLQTCCNIINGQKGLKRLLAEISHYSDHVPCMRISHSTLKRVVRLLSEQRAAVKHFEDSEKSVHQSYKEYIEKSESLNRRLRETQTAIFTSATSQGFSPIRLHELERVEDSMAHFESWKERFGKTLDDRLSQLRVMIDRAEEEHLCRTRDLYHCLKHLRNRIALYEGSIEYDGTESSRTVCARTEPGEC